PTSRAERDRRRCPPNPPCRGSRNAGSACRCARAAPRVDASTCATTSPHGQARYTAQRRAYPARRAAIPYNHRTRSDSSLSPVLEPLQAVERADLACRRRRVLISCLQPDSPATARCQVKEIVFCGVVRIDDLHEARETACLQHEGPAVGGALERGLHADVDRGAQRALGHVTGLVDQLARGCIVQRDQRDVVLARTEAIGIGEIEEPSEYRRRAEPHGRM